MRISGNNQVQPSATPMTAEDVSVYATDICRELATMARAAHLQFLAYLLEMAGQEAARGSTEKGARSGKRPPAGPGVDVET